MKKKIMFIIVAMVVIILLVICFITKYVDMGRVSTNTEPKYCIKIISDGGNKVTYWGLGYKVIRYPAVSPNEPYKNNIGVKMGSWFMSYKLTKYESLSVDLLMKGKTIKITKTRDIEAIVSLLRDSKYDQEICDGINTHKIQIQNDIYYIKEGCQEIQKGRKQAKISQKDFNELMERINQYDKYIGYEKTYILSSDKVDTEKLVKYNGNLYGKSFAMIDYVSNPEGAIGVIDKLIDSQYIPKYDGETNVEEILNAKVDSIGEKSIVLFYNNNYVLFHKIENQ